LVFPFNAFLLSFYLQSNFATLDEKTGIVTSRRADRHFEEEGPILCAALDGMRLPSFLEYEVRVRCKFFLNAVTY
jgi:2,3-bisphosphoglycerate-independent phosphoglycerate mutase